MNKRGSALTMTIIVVLILSILGTVLLSMSATNTKMVMHQERVQKAYYLARSGASAVADFIVNNPGMTDEQMKQHVADHLIGKTSTVKNYGDGSFQVKVEYADTASSDINILKVTGIGKIPGNGTFNDVVQEESIYLSSYVFTDKAIYANDIIEMTNLSVVNGDVHANNTVTVHNPATINGTIEYLPYYVYPQVKWPGEPDSLFPELLSIDTEHVIFFSDDVDTGDKIFKPEYFNKSFPSLQIKSSLSNATTEVEFQLTGDQDYAIMVDHLVVDNVNITINNYDSDNRLIIFVNETVEWKGSITADPSSFYLVVGKPPEHDGYVNMKTGSSTFEGCLYAPNALVEIEANLELKGTIICDTADLSSGGTVNYVRIDPLFSPAILGVEPFTYRTLYWGKP